MSPRGSVARAAGYAISRDQLQKGAVGIAAAIPTAWGVPAAIGVVALAELDEVRAAPAVMRVAASISDELS